MKDYKENKSDSSETFCNEIYSVVREIPVGSVVIYGDIAALFGTPQCSRIVGCALKQVPVDLSLPYHRIVSTVGRLVSERDEQRQLLSGGGVPSQKNGRIGLKPHRWKRASIWVG